jgi:hypothetical protein
MGAISAAASAVAADALVRAVFMRTPADADKGRMSLSGVSGT